MCRQMILGIRKCVECLNLSLLSQSDRPLVSSDPGLTRGGRSLLSQSDRPPLVSPGSSLRPEGRVDEDSSCPSPHQVVGSHSPVGPHDLGLHSGGGEPEADPVQELPKYW